MSQDFNSLVQLNQPNPNFYQDWSNYSSRDFAQTFLPNIPADYSQALTIYDGALLFKNARKQTPQTFPMYFNAPPVQIVCYTFPNEVPASEKRTFINPKDNELLVFMEVDNKEDINIHFLPGRSIIKLVENALRNTGTPFPAQIHTSNRKTLYEAFSGKPDQKDLLSFTFDTLGIDVPALTQAIEKYNPSNRIAIRVPGASEETNTPEIDFLEFFDSFVKKLHPGTTQNFNGELEFYRSKKQLEGLSGIDDTEYSGTFGFDRWDEKKSGNGKLSVHYFPNVTKISESYKAPFISLWAPKSKIENIPLSSEFETTTKATIWAKLTQQKDNSFNQLTAIHFECSNPTVLINGQSSGVIKPENAEASFKKGSSVSFVLETTDLIREYVPVVFRESGPTGKILGIFNLVPNNRIYTSNINLIDVEFATTDSLSDGKTIHPLADPLEKFCNNNSLNQAFIHVHVRPKSQKMAVIYKNLSKIRVDDEFMNYIAKSDEGSFHSAVLRKYDDLLHPNSIDQKEKDMNRIQKIIDDCEDPYFKKTPSKKELTKSIRNLLSVFKTCFYKTYVTEKNRLEKTYNDQAVKDAFIIYFNNMKTYRQLLLEIVLIQISESENSDLLVYKSVIEDLVLRGERVYSAMKEIDINTDNDLYMFLHKDIEALKDSSSPGGGVAGFTEHGNGFVQMFGLALNDPAFREELTTHEIGHAFDLSHTFESKTDSINQNFESKKKEIEDRKNRQLEEIKSSNYTPPSGDAYSTTTNEVNSIERYLSNGYRNRHLTIINKLFDETWIYQITNNERYSTNKPTEEEIIKIAENELKEQQEKSDNALQQTLDLEKAETLENFMDYDISKRNSFWFWQWQAMHAGKAPLKEHIL